MKLDIDNEASLTKTERRWQHPRNYYSITLLTNEVINAIIIFKRQPNPFYSLGLGIEAL